MVKWKDCRGQWKGVGELQKNARVKRVWTIGVRGGCGGKRKRCQGQV